MTAMADQKQVVFVNGTQIKESIKSISYQGTKATLTFSNGSSQTVDRSAVKVNFRGIATTGISASKVAKKHNGICYTLDGKRLNQPLKKGAYIKDGKKIVKK